MGDRVLPHFQFIIDMRAPRSDVMMLAGKHLEVQMGLRDFEIIRIDLLESGNVESPDGKMMPGMARYLIAYENNQLPN